MAHNEKLDICNKALLRVAGVENPEPQYDELTDNVWFFCPDCNEEYNLPETQIACPLCDCDQRVEL